MKSIFSSQRGFAPVAGLLVAGVALLAGAVYTGAIYKVAPKKAPAGVSAPSPRTTTTPGRTTTSQPPAPRAAKTVAGATAAGRDSNYVNASLDVSPDPNGCMLGTTVGSNNESIPSYVPVRIGSYILAGDGACLTVIQCMGVRLLGSQLTMYGGTQNDASAASIVILGRADDASCQRPGTIRMGNGQSITNMALMGLRN